MELLSVLLIVIGSASVCYTIIMCIILNFNTGTVITGVVALLEILTGIFLKQIIASHVLSVIALFILLFLLTFVMFVFFSGRRDTADFTEKTVIVLGAGIKGEKIPVQLKKRLDKAIGYHEKNPSATIIVSGGKGSEETVTEASAMKKYLTEKGIPEEKIITEEKSVSTYTNFLNSKAILDGISGESRPITFITSRYHVFRASLLAKKAGLDTTHCGSGIEWYAVPIRYFRECAAIVNLLFTGK